jgi:hypothetical protein
MIAMLDLQADLTFPVFINLPPASHIKMNLDQGFELSAWGNVLLFLAPLEPK